LGQKSGPIAGLLSLAGFLFLPSIGFLPGYLLKICCMFFLVHTVLTNSLMKRLFSVPILVVIGGMCYSIYLLHFAIISFAGQLLPRTGLDVQNHLYFIPTMLFFSAAVLIVSSIYFLLVEKPFMMPRGLGQKKKLPVPDSH
jgi:peptidoglycan/LPS O-acetylase OafA/YrhL